MNDNRRERLEREELGGDKKIVEKFSAVVRDLITKEEDCEKKIKYGKNFL